MEGVLEKFFLQVAALMDRARSLMLRLTMSVGFLRIIFCRRAVRLGVLFAFSCGICLVGALLFPLWVLALGPAIYGVPHLVSSLRYFHYSVSPVSSDGRGQRDVRRRAKVFAWLGAIMAGVAAYRLFMPVTGLSEWRGSGYAEILAMLGVFFAGVALYQKGSIALLRGGILLLPLLVCFQLWPAKTVGALVLLHNFVAFVYWWGAARSRAESGVAILAALILLALTVLIFCGSLDGIYTAWGTPTEELGFAGLNFGMLGEMIVPGSEDGILWRHAAVAYAFGQAVHYFVWLKAIPDQYHRNEVPTSFRQSLSLLGEDFGPQWMVRIIVLTLLSAGIWFLLNYPTARWVYFCLAAFHGYFEIAGLALRFSDSSFRFRTESPLVTPSP